jgi:hypothetical protein
MRNAHAILSAGETTSIPHTAKIPNPYAMEAGYVKRIFAMNFISAPAMGLTKIALLSLYLHTFTLGRDLRITVWIGIAICVLFSFASMIIASIKCTPRAGIWKLRQECAQYTEDTVLEGVLLWLCVNIIMFVVPICFIIQHKLWGRKKYEIVAIYTLGAP